MQLISKWFTRHIGRDVDTSKYKGIPAKRSQKLGATFFKPLFILQEWKIFSALVKLEGTTFAIYFSVVEWTLCSFFRPLSNFPSSSSSPFSSHPTSSLLPLTSSRSSYYFSSYFPLFIFHYFSFYFSLLSPLPSSPSYSLFVVFFSFSFLPHRFPLSFSCTFWSELQGLLSVSA